MSPAADTTIDKDTLVDLAERFLSAKSESKTSDPDFAMSSATPSSIKTPSSTILGIILHMGEMSLFVNFVPFMGDTIRTSLPRVARLALRSLKSLFYKGG
jgi:hypothetical protein